MSSVTLDSPSTPFVRSVFLDAPSWNHAGLPAWFVQSQLSAWEAFYQSAHADRAGMNPGGLRILKQLAFDAFGAQPAVEPGVETQLEKTAARPWSL